MIRYRLFASAPGRKLIQPILMGTCAASMGSTPLAVHLPTPASAAILFSGTFIIYFIATLSPLVNLQNFISSAVILPGCTVLLLISAFSITARLDLPEYLTKQYLAAGAVGVLYFLRFKSGKLLYKGLRSFLLIKNLSLALAWSLVTAPIDPNDGDTINIFIYRFTFIMALSICIDLRDRESDRKNGILTLPLLLGTQLSCLSAAALLITGYLTLVLFNSDSGGGNPAYAAAVTSCTAMASIVLFYNSRRKTYVGGIVDGNMLFHGIIFFLYHQHAYKATF